ncbi:MAG: hypothetical protein WKF96_12835 [Solirubrobacteraceae bacterium]
MTNIDIPVELGPDGVVDWCQRVDLAVQSAVAGQPGTLLSAQPPTPARHTSPDWTAFPVRVAECLGRDRALAVLDRAGDGSSFGGRALQEEYMEWRVVREADTIMRVELTTELSDYWRVLARHRPQRVLELAAEFAGEAAVDPAAVFGAVDLDGACPDEREAAFATAMLDPKRPGPYNDGRRAVCCMVHPSNAAGALAQLVAAAAVPRQIATALGPRAPTIAELTEPMAGAAVARRASDPVAAERVARMAFEGAALALSEPFGTHIAGIQHTRLHTPTGEAIPREWFKFSRPAAGPGDDSLQRYRRVTLAVPSEAGFAVGDLVDLATERSLRWGGEVAALVQLAVTFDAVLATVTGDREEISARAPSADAAACEQVRAQAAMIEAARP